MKLYLLHTKGLHHGETLVQPSIDTHNRWMGECDVQLFSIEGFSFEQLMEAIIDDAPEQFIVSTSNTILSGPWDPSRPHIRQVGTAKRKGLAIQKMVKTINYLLGQGLPCFDYEMTVPILFEKEKVEQSLNVVGADTMHFRTLYGNMHHAEAQRMTDPMIDLWIHSMQPPGPVTVLGETALKHTQCLKWIEKVHEEARAARPVQVHQG
jgi:hypothetical protein